MRIRESGKRKDATRVYDIPGELFPGKQIILKGRVPWGSTSFSINISSTPKMGDGDIILHFNARLPERVCVRNALINGSWGAEEKDQPFFPFYDGRSFTFIIEVTDDAFRIYVNGRHFVNFSHRTGYRKGNYLILREGAEYYDVIFQDKPIIPFSAIIHKGMKIGKTLRIRGMCTDQDGFAINFMDGGSNIYFHFNARPREALVVRNSKFGGWGKEEKDCPAGFPFNPLEYFDASFVCMEDKFAVYVNDGHFIDFYHRGNPTNITVLNVTGSVNIFDVDCLEPVGEDSMTEVESGLEKGDIFVLNGMMKNDGKTFAINFLNGFSADGDIALHFNPRRNTGDVVLNSRFGGAWQIEEKVPLPLVFWSNRPFQIKIETKKRKFTISLNGVRLAQYRMRDSVEKIRAIQISGDVFILETLLMKRLEDPIWERLPGGIRPGSWVILQGTPKKYWTGFGINFRYDDREDGDIAFLFNPRKNDGQVVRNHKQYNQWGPEERSTPNFPFDAGNTFEIVFFVREDKFLTYVNGKSFIEFNHRLPLERINFLSMKGDCNFYEPELLV
ncbi:galectin-4-like [Saccostrea cucullata]|uniref:galectin-4-like n=1 Tax=Saccostrea cuccullata TaxID=36930 RepID=UPI002ED482C3